MARQFVTRFFDRVSGIYDAPALQRNVYQPNHDAVVAVLRQMRPASVADVGCGTGVLTARIADEFGITVHGCDPSPGLLGKGMARSSKVSWHEASAECLPLENASVDAVTSTEAFHFFDQPAALAEFRRVLRPRGFIVIASFNLYPWIARLTGRDHPGAPLTTAKVLSERITRCGYTVLGQWPVKRFTRIWVPTTLTLARPNSPAGSVA